MGGGGEFAKDTVEINMSLWAMDGNPDGTVRKRSFQPLQILLTLLPPRLQAFVSTSKPHQCGGAGRGGVFSLWQYIKGLGSFKMCRKDSVTLHIYVYEKVG